MARQQSLKLLLEKAQTTDWNNLSGLRKSLLDIASHPEATEYQFEDALNIALEFDSPQIALDVHDVYEKRFGQPLSGDTSRQEIEALMPRVGERKLTQVRFRRQTILQRGHFSNYFTLCPVKEIVITTCSITFAISHYSLSTKTFEFAHSDVLEIQLRARESWKGMGGSSAKIHE